MKRFVCFLVLTALLVCLSLPVFAAPVKMDGRVDVIKEYRDTVTSLQIPKNESNNALTFAYLHWVTSPADYSVYLGMQYHCTDHALEDGMTGVEVRINDVLIGTVFADGTTQDVDADLYVLEGVFVVEDGPPYEVACEIRVGIRFWPDGEIVAGVRILDFSGMPSNYYRQLVYSPYTTTTKTEQTTAKPKTTTEKSTTTAASSAAGTTARTPRTTAPVITASPKRESTATTAVPTTIRPMAAIAAAVPKKTTKPKTTKPKTTKAKTTKPAETVKPSEAGTTASASETAVLAATTEDAETSASRTASAKVSNAQMYSSMNKVRIVGIVLVAVILTAAIMSSVFLGMRQKEDPKARNAKEEYEDFG